MYKMSTAAASLTAKLRWVRIPKSKRWRYIPRNGGRPRLYPPCKRYRAHHFSSRTGRCPCGYVKNK